MDKKTRLSILFASVILGTAAIIVSAQPSAPNAPLACGGGITVLLNGSPLSSGCVLNIKAGSGIIATPLADPAIGGTDLSFAVNSAIVPYWTSLQRNPFFLQSVNGTTAYTASLPNSVLQSGYQRGMAFLLLVDTPCSTGCTLNIDSNGVAAIKQADGTTDPATGQLPAGQPKWIWYDGTVWRLV